MQEFLTTKLLRTLVADVLEVVGGKNKFEMVLEVLFIVETHHIIPLANAITQGVSVMDLVAFYLLGVHFAIKARPTFNGFLFDFIQAGNFFRVLLWT